MALTAPAMEVAASPSGPSPSFPFSEITAPGAYVDHDQGWLLRVPPDALFGGRTPAITIVGNRPPRVSLISADPWIPISAARRTAADLGLNANF